MNLHSRFVSLAGLLLSASLALSTGCATLTRETATETRITNYSDATIGIKLVFDAVDALGDEQADSATVRTKLDAFAAGRGVTMASIEPGVLTNSRRRAIAGNYQIEPSGFMIVDVSWGGEPEFAFEEMTVTTQNMIRGHHTRESVRHQFERTQEFRYEYKVGAPEVPAGPTHMTQADFDALLSSSKASLTGDGMEIIRDHHGKLRSGESHIETLPAMNSDWIHYALVVGDGSFIQLHVNEPGGNPAYLMERENFGEPSAPAVAFAPVPAPGYTATVVMDNCPASSCNYALLVLRDIRPAPPRHPPLDMAEISVGPDNTVSWEHAKIMIQRGHVDYVFQAHSRRVQISMANGENYQTTQPEHGAVIDWVEACGKKDWIAIMME